MKGLTILDLSRDGVNQILTSKSATWNIKENIWDFFNGTIYLISPNGSYRNIVRFQHQQLALPRAPLDLAQRPPNSKEMTISQAKEYLKIVKLSANEKEIRKLQVRIPVSYTHLTLPTICSV